MPRGTEGFAVMALDMGGALDLMFDTDLFHKMCEQVQTRRT